MNDDQRALLLLEESIYRAREVLKEKETFWPFAVVLMLDGRRVPFESDLKSAQGAYHSLYERLQVFMRENVEKVDIVVLLCDTEIPVSVYSGPATDGIRVHLEECSQQHQTIAGRFIYVPYVRYAEENKEIAVELKQPIPVSFPSEFFSKTR